MKLATSVKTPPQSLKFVILKVSGVWFLEPNDSGTNMFSNIIEYSFYQFMNSAKQIGALIKRVIYFPTDKTIRYLINRLKVY